MYRHTQVAVWLPVVGGALAGVLAWRAGSWAVAGPPLLILLAVFGLFGTLTTTVADGRLTCVFGPFGLIRRRLALAEIRAARAVRTSPWWGWGLRWTPRGWLWNIWGLDAVELDLTSGSRFLVGTDEPRRLLDALRQGA